MSHGENVEILCLFAFLSQLFKWRNTHLFNFVEFNSICAKTIVPPKVMPEHMTEKPNKNEQNNAGRLCFNTNHCVINLLFLDRF